MVRHDTLITGDVRTLTGHVKIHADTSDHIFGFLFWAKEDSVKCQLVFNGNMSYQTDEDQKVYSISTDRSAMKDVLYSPAGRMVVPDLIKLDTSGNDGLTVSQDEGFYYLTISYPDLTKYDVIKRYKTVTIDKTNMLPVAVRQHQQTLDKVQDLTWEIDQMRLNEKAFHYDFADPDFISTYTLKVPVVMKGHPLMGLKGKQAPPLELKSFDDKLISLQDTTGRVVLLDFWEVWCGPCVESMPKVKHLYDKFKSKGLIVYGIVNDLKQIESARKFISRKPEISFPILIGNDRIKKDYLVNAVPQYVLIGRDGKVSFLSLGYCDEIESEIEKALNAN